MRQGRPKVARVRLLCAESGVKPRYIRAFCTGLRIDSVAHTITLELDDSCVNLVNAPESTLTVDLGPTVKTPPIVPLVPIHWVDDPAESAPEAPTGPVSGDVQPTVESPDLRKSQQKAHVPTGRILADPEESASVPEGPLPGVPPQGPPQGRSLGRMQPSFGPEEPRNPNESAHFSREDAKLTYPAKR